MAPIDSVGVNLAKIRAIQSDKLYVTQTRSLLYKNAENLLVQAASLAEPSDVTVLELPSGGYYLITGNDHDLAAMQAEHGARSAWQVRHSPSGILVSGQSGNDTCVLKRGMPARHLTGTLRDAPAYLLI